MPPVLDTVEVARQGLARTPSDHPDDAAERWLAMCGAVQPGDAETCAHLRDLIYDGVDPSSVSGRRLLLKVELPDVWWGEGPRPATDRFGNMELADRWIVSPDLHAPMLELVATQLFDVDTLGLRDAARELAAIGMTRREILNQLAIVACDHHDANAATIDNRGTADALEGLVEEMLDGDHDCGEFGIELLNRAVAAGEDERAERIVRFRLSREQDEEMRAALYSDLARAYEDAGRIDEALDALDRASLESGDGESRSARRVLMLLRAGRSDEARRELETLLASGPHHAYNHRVIAVACERAGEIDLARRWCDDGIRAAVDSHSVSYHDALSLADLLLIRGNLQGEAPDPDLFAAAEAVIGRSSELALNLLHKNRGWRRYRKRHLTRAVETAPGRNDPCPCGSGRKHKRCCLHR